MKIRDILTEQGVAEGSNDLSKYNDYPETNQDPWMPVMVGEPSWKNIPKSLEIWARKKGIHRDIQIRHDPDGRIWTIKGKGYPNNETVYTYKWLYNTENNKFEPIPDEQGVAEGSGTVDINSIASELRFLPTTKQAKRYRFVANGRPGQMPAMSYTVSQQEQPVVTVTADGKETQNVAGVNDIIMSGPSRENYVVKAAKFPKLYQGQLGQTVIPEQSPRQVAQYQGRNTVTFTAPWGESMVLKPGDYLVRDGDQGYYRIAQAEYGQTYNPPGR